MKYVFSILLVLVFAIGQAQSSSRNIFEDHKLQTYSPIKAGVKDLLFDIRVEGLVERVKKTTALTNLNDLYFRVYWAYPDQYRIDVEGLPKGFNMLRRNLKATVKPFVDIIFSEDFIRQFERVPFNKDPSGKNKYIKKKDKNDVSEVRVSFNNKGILEEINSMSPYSKVKTVFSHNLRSWSKGKHVVTKVSITQLASGMTDEKDILIERGVFSGVGLPKELVVDQRLKRGDQIINSSKQKYFFSNYNVNTDKASRILRGKKK